MTMGTIPPTPMSAAGNTLPSAYLTQMKSCIDFWASAPRCYAYQLTSAQTVSLGVMLAVTLDTEVFDMKNNYDGASDGGMHDNVAANTRIYARTPGKYEITGQVMFAPNPTGGRVVQVRTNAGANPASGTLVAQSSQSAVTAASTATGVPLPTVEIVMAVNDYVEMFASQTSGGDLGLSTGQANTFLRLRLTGS